MRPMAQLGHKAQLMQPAGLQTHNPEQPLLLSAVSPQPSHQIAVGLRLLQPLGAWAEAICNTSRAKDHTIMSLNSAWLQKVTKGKDMQTVQRSSSVTHAGADSDAVRYFHGAATWRKTPLHVVELQHLNPALRPSGYSLCPAMLSDLPQDPSSKGKIKRCLPEAENMKSGYFSGCRTGARVGNCVLLPHSSPSARSIQGL